MADEEYNGWTNYETWCVNLHIDNTQSSQEEWQQEAAAALEVAREDLEAVSDVPFDDFKVREEAIHVLRRVMQDEFCGDNAPELPGFYGDLLRAALSEVNWHEIARHYIDAAITEADNA
jgi:hypothetical protein